MHNKTEVIKYALEKERERRKDAAQYARESAEEQGLTNEERATWKKLADQNMEAMVWLTEELDKMKGY